MSKIKKTVIGKILLDIDSTLYPMDSAIRNVLQRFYGLDLPEVNQDTWTPWRQLGLTDEQGLRVLDICHTDEEILRQKPFAGAVATVRKWVKAGVEVHVVSHRSPRSAGATKSWLAKIGLPYDALALDFMVDKLAYAQKNQVDLIIDDKPTLIEQAVAAGLPIATLRYPYNQALLAQYPDQIVMGSNWRELRVNLERRYRFSR
jgi:uncharacterized HAD superfamily protein